MPRNSEVANIVSRTWVLQSFLAVLTGQTINALNELRKKNRVRKGFHWIKSNGRIYFHYQRYMEWLESTQV
jgi:hypothetical protein